MVLVEEIFGGAEMVEWMGMVVMARTSGAVTVVVVRVAVEATGTGVVACFHPRLICLGWIPWQWLAVLGLDTLAVWPHIRRVIDCQSGVVWRRGRQYVWLLRSVVSCQSRMWVSLGWLHVHMGGDENVSWGCEFSHVVI